MASHDPIQFDLKEILAVSQAINHLGIHLYKQLIKEQGNVFFSPISISSALAMVFCGAKHETAEEMKSVFGYEVANIADEEVRFNFQKLLSAVDQTQDSYTLNSANVIFSQQDFHIKEEFKNVMQESFKSMILEVDFNRKLEEAVQQANDWVKDKTNGMIPKILESLDTSTLMVILNAIYFKGFWMNPFKDNDTFLQYFYNEGEEDNAKLVEMMHLKDSFPFVEKETLKAIQLPYKGEDLCMFILLPNARNGLEALESQVSSEFLQELKSEMHKFKVEVALPKFQLEYSKSLKDKFQSLGMNRAFLEGAHFGDITDSDNLLISEIIHKAVLVVNEEGSEAAAASAVVMVGYSLLMCPEFIVDHPFLFLIYNSKMDLILFMGKVEEL